MMKMNQIMEWMGKGLVAKDSLLYTLAMGKLTQEADRRGLTFQELLSVARGENG